MTADDWFRNSSWNDSIAELFEAKLKRARRKEQYLRIQAGYLASAYPDVALQLLDRYFELPDKFDNAQGFVDRARAMFSLGRDEEAVASYEAALAREAEFPNLRTTASIDLPYQIAVRSLRDHFPRAGDLLEKCKDDLMFPVDHFKWHACEALLSSAKGLNALARSEARLALEAASRSSSGFTYHPRAGLVSDKYNAALALLRPLCDS